MSGGRSGSSFSCLCVVFNLCSVKGLQEGREEWKEKEREQRAKKNRKRKHKK